MKRKSILDEFDEFVENAPVDFLGTGNRATERAESREWDERVASLRKRIRALERKTKRRETRRTR